MRIGVFSRTKGYLVTHYGGNTVYLQPLPNRVAEQLQPLLPLAAVAVLLLEPPLHPHALGALLLEPALHLRW